MRCRYQAEFHPRDLDLEPEISARKGLFDIRDQGVEFDRPLHQAPRRDRQRQDDHADNRAEADEDMMQIAADPPRRRATSMPTVRYPRAISRRRAYRPAAYDVRVAQ